MSKNFLVLEGFAAQSTFELNFIQCLDDIPVRFAGAAMVSARRTGILRLLPLRKTRTTV